MTAPLFFEDRKDGRIAAMLGAIEVGEILPIKQDHFRAAYKCALPSAGGRGPVLVRNVDMAKLRLRRHVGTWLKAAGISE